jgi:hypothetical protein
MASTGHDRQAHGRRSAPILPAPGVDRQRRLPAAPLPDRGGLDVGPHPGARIQRLFGNQAVQMLLASLPRLLDAPLPHAPSPEPAHGDRSAAPGPTVEAALRAPGQPLDPATRTRMETGFGHGFADVRIHTGPVAEASAQALSSAAFTLGGHIVFGPALRRLAPGP